MECLLKCKRSKNYKIYLKNVQHWREIDKILRWFVKSHIKKYVLIIKPDIGLISGSRLISC